MLAFLAKALGLPVKVLRFPSRDAAIRALENGEIDLLGTSNGFEAATPTWRFPRRMPSTNRSW